MLAASLVKPVGVPGTVGAIGIDAPLPARDSRDVPISLLAFTFAQIEDAIDIENGGLLKVDAGI